MKPVVSVRKLETEEGAQRYATAVYTWDFEGACWREQTMPNPQKNEREARGDARQYARFMGYRYQADPPTVAMSDAKRGRNDATG